MYKKIDSKGFTLIELLVVISIIGALVGMFTAGIPAIKTMARKRKAQSTIQGLEMALSMYKNDFSIYPNDESNKEVMNVLTGYKDSAEKPDPSFKQSPDWNGPYFDAKASECERRQKNLALMDPWMSKYNFNLSDPQHNTYKCDIWSSGPNRKNELGKGDDIPNW